MEVSPGGLMWARVQLTSHIQLTPLSWWGTTCRGFGTVGLSWKKRTVTGLWRQPSRASLLRRTFVVHLANLSERPPHLLYIYIYYALDAESFYVAYCLFDSEITGNGGHGKFSRRSVIFILLVPAPLPTFWLTLVLLSART
jgi:hypothetical protein